ncbi:MAG: hypothetical protein QXZ48_07855 [Zestosphaera sp.]
MTYDFIGEKLRKIKSLLQGGYYYQAFQELMSLLKIVRPTTKDWVSLVELAGKIVEKIEDPAQKARALLDLSECLRTVDYEEYRRIVSVIEDLLLQISDESLVREIKTRIESKPLVSTRPSTVRSSTDEILVELANIKRRLIMDPYLASKLEAIIMENEKLLSGSVKNEIISLLDKYPPKIKTETEVLSPNPVVFPSNLEFKIKLLNEGYRVAKDIKIVARLNSGTAIEELVISPIVESSLRLKPNESRVVQVKVPVKTPGKYDVFIGTKYCDLLGKEYQGISTLVLKDLEIVILSVSEAFQKGRDDEFNKVRVELTRTIYDVLGRVIKLHDMMVDRKSVEEINNLFGDIVKDLNTELLKKLKDVRDMYKRYMQSCSPINSFYEKITREVEDKVNSLLKAVSDKKVLRRSIMHRTVALEEEVYECLRIVIRHVISVAWVEDPEKMEKLVSKLRGEGIQSRELTTEERNLVILIHSVANEKSEESLKTYKEIREIVKSVEFAKSYKDVLSKLSELVVTELNKLRVSYRY